MIRTTQQWIAAAAVLTALSTARAQEQNPQDAQTTLLRWRNGDVLPGKLLDSEPGKVSWSSPRFLDQLVVDADVLDSILFSEELVRPEETFRIGMASGDVWVADLIGADEESFIFTSKRHGRVRVDRDAVYTLGRREQTNLVFDGSQLEDWDSTRVGPIKYMTYRAYDYHRGWGETLFPDFSELTPRSEGALASGWLDLELTRMTDNFAMVFEGQLQTTQSGEYTFELSCDDHARVFIDGREIAEATASGFDAARTRLTAGSHTLRVEFVELGGIASLSVWWTGPDLPRTPLFGTNGSSGWRRGPGGHPQTDHTASKFFRLPEFPQRFELDLELESSDPPRFVLALGENLEDALRLETWADELVIVQGDLFEPVFTIEEAQRDVRLRFVFDGIAGLLTVFDATGRLLVKLEGVRSSQGDAGLLIRNRGRDLTVRRLTVTRQPNASVAKLVDPSRARVRLIDGQVVYGRLFVGNDGAYVMDEDEPQTRRSIDLAQVDRIARPGIQLAEAEDTAELNYADGTIVRGEIERLSAGRVTLRTKFAETPVECSLEGASALRLGPLKSTRTPERRSRGDDQLFSPSGRLRGQLSFGESSAPLRWQPPGAASSVRLTHTRGARVERGDKYSSTTPSFDTKRFPHALHLKSGEVLPCRVTSYDESTLAFESPFVSGRKIDPALVKGIEFRNLAADGSLEEPVVVVRSTLERALTVPRFHRDNPPSHLLVAKTGDLKRGVLLGITGDRVEFESKLRKMSVPTDRLARVVDVSRPEEATDEPDRPEAAIETLDGTIRVTLSDGSILGFVARRSSPGKLLGSSPVYEDVAIPTESIRRLKFCDLREEMLESMFGEWVVRPAREPEFGGQH